MEIKQKISHFIENEFPAFFQKEADALIRFIELYYEWMDQENGLSNLSYSLINQTDIDLSEDYFLNFFKKEFLTDIPAHLKVDERFLIKHIADFYRTKGSEESFRILFRILFNEEISFYYPGSDILRISAGEWVVEKSILLSSNSPFDVLNSRNTIRGETSNATARVDYYNESIKNGILKKELFLSNIIGSFLVNENILDDSTGNIIATNLTDGIIIHPGKYISNEGFLSDRKYIQDNDYYQDYSYEIQSSKSRHLYDDVVNSIVHPAGTKMFGKVMQIISDIEENVSDMTEINLKMPEIDIVNDQRILEQEIDEIKKLSFIPDSNSFIDNSYSYLLKDAPNNGSLYQSAISVTPGEVYTLSIDVLPGNQEFITISVDDWSDIYLAIFDMYNKEYIKEINVTGNYSTTNDGRIRLSVTFIVPTATFTFQPKIKAGSIIETKLYKLNNRKADIIIDVNNDIITNDGIVKTLSDMFDITSDQKLIFDQNNILQTIPANTLYIDSLNGTRGLLVEKKTTNIIKNNSYYDGLTVPSNWSVSTVSGISYSISKIDQDFGCQYIQISLVGTATTNGNITLSFLCDTDSDILIDKQWCYSILLSSTSSRAINLVCDEYDSSNNLLISHSKPFATSSILHQDFLGFNIENDNTTSLHPYLSMSVTSGDIINIKLNIAYPQLENNDKPSSIILTTNSKSIRNRDIVSFKQSLINTFNNDNTFIVEGIDNNNYFDFMLGGDVIDLLTRDTLESFKVFFDTTSDTFTQSEDKFSLLYSRNNNKITTSLNDTNNYTNIFSTTNNNNLYLGPNPSNSVGAGFKMTRLILWKVNMQSEISYENLILSRNKPLVYNNNFPTYILNSSSISLWPENINFTCNDPLISNTNISKNLTNSSMNLVSSMVNTNSVSYLGGQSKFIVEGPSSNLVTYSNDLTNSVWIKDTINVTNNQYAGWKSTNDLALINETSNTSNLSRSFSLANNTNYTFSFIIKRGNCDFVRVSHQYDSASAKNIIWINLADGTITETNSNISHTILARTITKIKEGVYRVSISFNTISSYVNFDISSATSTGSLLRFNSASYYIGYFQLEQTSIATSFISSTGSVLNRTQDFSSFTSTVINEINNKNCVLSFIFEVNQLNINNNTILSINSDIDVIKVLNYQTMRLSNGTNNIDATFDKSKNRITIFFNNTNTIFFINGQKYTLNGTLPNITTNRLGASVSGINFLDQLTLDQILLWHNATYNEYDLIRQSNLGIK